MANDLEIVIGANTTKLVSEVKSAEATLKNFASSANKSSTAIGGGISGSAAKSTESLHNLTNAAQATAGGLDATATAVLPLVQRFASVRAESGSAQTAIKDLTGSLAGGGGLTLAFTLAASAVLLLIQNPEKAAAALNYLSGATVALTEDQKKYREEVVKYQSSAMVEINTLNTLIGIARNESLSRDARTEAVKRLNAEYPEQLGSLTLEGVESKKTAAAIDILSRSLLRKAKIEAANKLLGDAFAKQLKAQTTSAIEQASVLSSAVNLGMNVIGFKSFVALNNGLQNQAEAFKKAGEEVTAYDKILKKLNTEEAIDGTLFDDPIEKEKKKKKLKAGPDIKTISDVYGALAVDLKQIDATVDGTFGDLAQSKVKAFKKAIDGLIEVGLKPTDNLVKKMQERLKDATNFNYKNPTTGKQDSADFSQVGKRDIRFASLADGLGTYEQRYLKTAELINKTPLVPPPAPIKTGFAVIIAEIVRFNENAAGIISGGIVSTFASIGEAIGNSLATGASLASTLGSSLLSALGAVLAQLGQMAIATGVAILGIKIALKTLNPVAAIAAGVGLLALSGVVKAGAAKLGGSMGGGGGGDFGGGSTPSSSNFQTGGAVNNFNGGRVVFEIAGTKLVGVLQNTLGANSRIIGKP